MECIYNEKWNASLAVALIKFLLLPCACVCSDSDVTDVNTGSRPGYLFGRSAHAALCSPVLDEWAEVCGVMTHRNKHAHMQMYSCKFTERARLWKTTCQWREKWTGSVWGLLSNPHTFEKTDNVQWKSAVFKCCHRASFTLTPTASSDTTQLNQGVVLIRKEQTTIFFSTLAS